MLILGISKVYLHPMKYEHFGMAIVEAMASGVIPVVHKSGGPWTDIVEYGKYGFGFKSIDEAVGYISNILEMNQNELQNWRLRLLEKIRIFSYDVFQSKIERLIKAFLGFKTKDYRGYV